MRTCKRCEKTKKITEFYTSKGKTRGECKKCTIKKKKKSLTKKEATAEYMASYYQRNKENYVEYRRRFLQRNPDYFRDYRNKKKSG